MLQSVTVKIGAVLTPGFSAQFTKADAAIKKLQQSVVSLNRVMQTLKTNSQSIQNNLGAGSSSATNRLIQQNQKLTQSYRSLNRQRQMLSKPVSMGGIGGGGRGGLGGGALPTPKTPSGGVGMGQAGYALTHAGMIAVGAGVVLGEGVKSLVESGAEYIHQLAEMRVLHFTNLEMVTATKKAWELTTKLPWTTPTENLQTFRELYAVFGSLAGITGEDATKGALANVETVLKVQQILGSMGDKFGGKEGAKDYAYTLARALELRGGKAILGKPEEFKEQAEGLTKAMMVLGGKVTPSDFLMAFKYARGAAQGWNNEFMTTVLPTFIQEMKSYRGSGGGGVGGGSSGTGTPFRAVFDKMITGNFSKQSREMLQQLGLIDTSKVKATDYDKKGELKGVPPGAIVGMQEFIANPFAWSQKYLLPKFKAMHLNEDEMKEYIARMFPDALSHYMLQQFTLPSQTGKIFRDQPLYARAAPTDEVVKYMKAQDPFWGFTILQAQWKAFKTALSDSTFMDGLNKRMDWLAIKLNAITMWIRSKQDSPVWHAIFKGAGDAVIALTALLVVGGGLILMFGMLARAAEGLKVLREIMGVAKGGTMLGTLFGGVSFGAALAILAGIAVAALLIYHYWEPIKAFFQGVWESIKEAFGGKDGIGAALKEAFAPLMPILKPIWEWLKGIFHQAHFSADSLKSAMGWGKAFGQILGWLIKFDLKVLQVEFKVLATVIMGVYHAILWTFTKLKEFAAWMDRFKPGVIADAGHGGAKVESERTIPGVGSPFTAIAKQRKADWYLRPSPWTGFHPPMQAPLGTAKTDRIQIFDPTMYSLLSTVVKRPQQVNVTNTVTVQVATNADPDFIGDAVKNALHSFDATKWTNPQNERDSMTDH